MYTLILTITLFHAGYNQAAGSVTVASVSGFSTQQQCLDAGNAWLKQQRAISSPKVDRALCAKVGDQ